jgi:hypothetical protein
VRGLEDEVDEAGDYHERDEQERALLADPPPPG